MHPDNAIYFRPVIASLSDPRWKPSADFAGMSEPETVWDQLNRLMEEVALLREEVTLLREDHRATAGALDTLAGALGVAQPGDAG